MDPMLLKTIHILSAILLFGTGLGTAFHGLASNLSKDVRAIAVADRNVVLADWLFTTPAVVLQPVTGIWLAVQEGWPLSTGWIIAALILYVIAGACWLPVVHLQLKMRDMAVEAAATGSTLPDRYFRMFRIWFALGLPAFAAMIAIVALMVFKPQLSFLQGQ
jgi:uncharacterized membrane protein